MNLKAFFFQKNGRLEPAFKFAVGTFLFELLLSLLVFNSISKEVRFKGFISVENIQALTLILFFFLRVFLVHLFFGICLRFLEKIFYIQTKKTFYLSWVVYAYLFLAIKFPQNYDEIHWVTSALQSLKLFEYPWIRHVPALFILGLCLISFLRAPQRKIVRWIPAALTFAFLCFYFSSLQLFALKPSELQGPATARKTTRPHIIFITVDSLRGDADIEKLSAVSDGLKNFLNDSVKFDRVISPLPQTHGAITALMTSSTPPRNLVRTNLSLEGSYTDKVMADSPLKEIKDAGYKVKFVMDTMEYANFKSGNTIDTVDAPDFSVANVVVSTFFKNRIVFGLFNNPLGRFLLPELNHNSSFFYSYELPLFTNHVLKELDKVAQSDTPEFLYIHTCSLHWPAIFPYPYYPQDSFPEHSYAPFSYTSKFRGLSPQPLSEAQWKEQSRFNHRIYASGIDMTVQDFLNPLFDQLKKSGLDENAIVVLLSDHGENLWNPDSIYPKAKMVEHGGSLLFGSSGELSFFRLKSAGLKAQHIDGTVGLIDIFPTVMNLAGLSSKAREGVSFVKNHSIEVPDQSYYVETGLWPFSAFPGQFLSTPATNLGPLLKLDKQNWKLHVDPVFLPGIVQQKQRALYHQNYRYTLYPTDGGMEEFLCDTAKDPNCEINLTSQNVEMTKRLRAEIEKYIAYDVQTQNLKLGACSKLQTEPSAKPDFSDVGKFQWQYYFQALECLRETHDYAYTNRIFEKLVASEDVSTRLKRKILANSLVLCNWATAFNSYNMPDYLKAHLSQENLADPSKLAFPKNTQRCLALLGRSEDAASLETFLAKKISEETLDGEEDPPNLDSQRILEETKKLVSQQNENPLKVKAALENYFAIEMNYNMVDRIEPFLFLYLKDLFRKQTDIGVLTMMEFLKRPERVGISFFNYILEELDLFTVPGYSTRQLALLRHQPWDADSLSRRPNKLRTAETSMALKKAELYLCTKKSPYCKQAQSILKSTLSP